MTVYEILKIAPGESITVDNPNTDSGPRLVIPLGLSKNEISIRVIDCRYGDIRYVYGDWTIFADDGSEVQLKTFPHIKEKIKEWKASKRDQEKALLEAKKLLTVQYYPESLHL